ncbi:MAG: alkaline phosphatase family protein, partial [Myxococcales bacterium]|nr:alkaline phosphatase family protein [Myxococcales bacterium]
MVGIDLHRRIRRCESAPALAVCVLTLLMAPAIPASADAGTPSAPTVIMISLDGTTYPQIERADLEWIPKLMRRGATAKRLVPVFPSNTFPNHVSLITGVPPEVHGIVNNAFLDPDRGEYDYDADPTWLEVEPLWAIAARHGVVSASYHWVGSEGAWRN